MDKEYIGNSGWFVSSTARAAARMNPKDLMKKADEQLKELQKREKFYLKGEREKLYAAFQLENNFNFKVEKSHQDPLKELRDKVLNFKLKIFYDGIELKPRK